MEPPNPYTADRFLKEVQVTELENRTQVRYDIVNFGEFRYAEARFGGWQLSRGLRFRVKVHIIGASKGVFLFIYLVFDNDPWTGKWSADLQCSFRILSLNGTGDLTGATKTYALSNNNYYIVAGFPVNVIRKKGSGLVTSTDTVRIQADIEWGDVQIVNNYEQLLQYKEDVKVKNALSIQEREELIRLRLMSKDLRERNEKLSREREDILRRIDIICQGQRAAEAYAAKLKKASEEIMLTYSAVDDHFSPTDDHQKTAVKAPVRPSRARVKSPE